MSLAVWALQTVGKYGCDQRGRGERTCPTSKYILSICKEPCSETLGTPAQVAATGKKAARAPRASSPDGDGSEASEDRDADNAYLAERTARLAANKRQLAALGLGGDGVGGARKAARRAAGGSSAEGSDGTGSEPGGAPRRMRPAGWTCPCGARARWPTAGRLPSRHGPNAG